MKGKSAKASETAKLPKISARPETIKKTECHDKSVTENPPGTRAKQVTQNIKNGQANIKGGPNTLTQSRVETEIESDSDLRYLEEQT